jgi:hypothetical protein
MGAFPEGSVNFLVEARLGAFARERQAFSRAAGTDKGEAT